MASRICIFAIWEWPVCTKASQTPCCSDMMSNYACWFVSYDFVPIQDNFQLLHASVNIFSWSENWCVLVMRPKEFFLALLDTFLIININVKTYTKKCFILVYDKLYKGGVNHTFYIGVYIWGDRGGVLVGGQTFFLDFKVCINQSSNLWRILYGCFKGAGLRTFQCKLM